jgi:hypothetical protein
MRAHSTSKIWRRKVGGKRQTFCQRNPQEKFLFSDINKERVKIATYQFEICNLQQEGASSGGA